MFNKYEKKMKNLVIIKYLVALFVCGNSLIAKGQLEDFKINASEVLKKTWATK